MIYDAFLFFNELELLKLRLQLLDDVVDKFVLVESTLTHQGEEKPLFFDQNKKAFEAYADKIIHVVIDDPIERYADVPMYRYQRDAISRGLRDCKDGDHVLISDLDEIPSPAKVREYSKNNANEIVLFKQRLYYYFFNCYCTGMPDLPWSCMVPFSQFTSPQKIRDLVVSLQGDILATRRYPQHFNGRFVDDGGWHFSYFGGVERVITKIESFADSEFNKDEFKDREAILHCMLSGKDLYGRPIEFQLLDEKSEAALPEVVRNNKQAYADFFLPESSIQDKGHNKSSASTYKILFDQYSRYRACAEILLQLGATPQSKILDVGSGSSCLLSEFLSGFDISYVDPLIADLPNRLPNQFAFRLEEVSQNLGLFDYVVTVDVLEHIEPKDRHGFIHTLGSLAKKSVILAFPYSDSDIPAELDRAIDADYRLVTGHSYSWLDEHEKYGLPSVAETVKQLSELDLQCQTVGHGHVPWLRELLGLVVCAWDIHSLKDFISDVSEKFNRRLFHSDFRPPYYRQFVIATRSPHPPVAVPANVDGNFDADAAFRTLMDDARRAYFFESIRRLRECETTIERLHASVEEVSSWAKSLNATLIERDEALSKKQAELMSLSDWADGMRRELARYNGSVATKVLARAGRFKAAARGMLARSFVGDLVRHVRNKKRYKKTKTTLEVIRESLIANNGKLIITFPIITWNFRWQRPQHIVTRLRNRGYSVLYVAMSVAALERKFRNRNEAGALLSFTMLEQHIHKIWLHSAAKLNVYSDPIKDDDLYNLVIGLSVAIDELKPTSIDYLVQFPGWWPVAQALRERHGGSIIFDCMDDHAGFSTNSLRALQTEEQLIEAADLVITSSKSLEDKVSLLTPKTIQVKNGTEFEHFKAPRPNGELDHLLGRPIIGYYGAISDWFDMELLAYCAKSHPDWNFVLIGATFGADLKLVDGLKNVYFLGEKKYTELPGYLAYFDVCTIPFKIIPLTLATNPVKFYEYISAGKPVVSVDLPELLPYNEDCYLAKDPAEFDALLVRALNERNDPEKIRRRVKLANENSWDSRVDAIVDAVNTISSRT